MEEIAAIIATVSISDDIHQSAAEVFQRLTKFSNQEISPNIYEVLVALCTDSEY